MSQYIKSVQKVSVTVAGTASGTATITAVNTANTIIIPDWLITSTTSGTTWLGNVARFTLTNSTTVTVNRDTASLSTITVKGTIVEFNSDVNSVQSGFITVTAGTTSNTATISSVGSNAWVVWLGNETTSGSAGYSDAWGSALVLTNSTTVTASIGTSLSADLKVGYMVVDLTSNIIKSVQAISKTDASASTSYTTTIASVATGNTLLFFNGFTGAVATSSMTNLAHHIQLTAATTVTWTRSGTGTVSRTLSATVVEFQSGALNGAVQRGTISGTGSGATNTATIASVDTTVSFVNCCGVLSGATPNNGLADVVLTNGTTVTAAVNGTYATTSTLSYEVIQFDNTPGGRTGDASITFGAVTLSAAAAVAVIGSLSVSLGSLLLSANNSSAMCWIKRRLGIGISMHGN